MPTWAIQNCSDPVEHAERHVNEISQKNCSNCDGTRDLQKSVSTVPTLSAVNRPCATDEKS